MPLLTAITVTASSLTLLLLLPHLLSSGLSSPYHRSSPRKRNRSHGPQLPFFTSSPLAPQAGFAPGHLNISTSASHSRSTSDMMTPDGSTSTPATSTIPAMIPPGYAPAVSFSAYGGEGIKSAGGGYFHMGRTPGSSLLRSLATTVASIIQPVWLPQALERRHLTCECRMQ